MGVELAVGYISLVADTKQIPKQIKQALGEGQKGADKVGADIGSKMSGGLNRTLKAGLLGAGVAAGAVMAGAVVKGMGRLTAIDDAQGKLRGLGHDAKSVETIMDSALAAVKGTAFGLGDAATVAASAVAAGITPGKELTKYLSLTGDAASIAGMEMSEMGSIFNKVAASNKIQGDVIAQLADAGIPIIQLLGEEMGKTAEEVYKLASDGKINFETFQKAMDAGLGGAALEAGNTVTGAAKNMQAALGRLGAAALGPGFVRLPGAMEDITNAFDDTAKHVGPLAKALDSLVFDKLLPDNFDAGKMVSGLTGTVLDGATAGVTNLGYFVDTELPGIVEKAKSLTRSIWESDLVSGSVDSVVGVFWTLVDAAKRAGPAVLQIGKSLGEASAALGVSTWQVFLRTLEAAATIADSVLVPALEMTAGFMRDNKVVVIGLVAAFAAFKTVPMMIGAVSAATAAMGARMAAAVAPVASSTAGVRASLTAMRSEFRTLQPAIGSYGAAMRTLGNHNSTIRNMQNAFMGASTQAGAFKDSLKVLGTSAGGGVKSAMSGLSSALGGPLNMALMVGAGLLVAWASSAQQAKQQAKQYEATISSLAKSQNDVTRQLLSSGGNVDDTIMSKLAGQVDTLKKSFEDAGAKDAKFGDVVSSIFGTLTNNIIGTSGLAKELDRAAGHNQNVFKVFEKMEVSSEHVAKVLAGSRGEFDMFLANLRGMGSDGETAADGLLKLREDLDQAKELARRVSPQFLDISTQFRTMSDNMASADSKGDALYRTLQLIAGINPDLKQSTDAMNKQIRELKASPVADPSLGSGAELFDAETGRVSTVTENGQSLSDEVSEAIDSAAHMVKAGGDAETAIANVGTVIEETARKFGVEVPKMREAFEKHGLNEEVLRVTANLEKAGEQAGQFGAVWADMKALEKSGQERVRTGIREDDAPKELRDKIQNEFGGKVNKKTENGVDTYEIDLRDEEAWRKYNEWVNALAAVGKLRADAKLGMDITGFNTSSDEAKNVLKKLTELEAKPGADLNISGLLAKKEISVEELAELRDKVTNPEVLLNIIQLLNQAGVADTTLDGVANKPRTAFINVQANIAVANAAIAGTIATMSAAQGIPVTPRADGGIQNLPQQAMIQPGNGAGLIQWAEGETGGEAFIPMAMSKRGRSTSILADVAQRFGYGLTKYAEGGINGIQAALNAGRTNVKTYLWGGTGMSGWDCSGWVGWLQQIVMGASQAEAAGKRLYTTYSLLGGSLAGLRPGLGPAGTQFQVGVSQEHMAATIAGHPAESGGSHGDSRIGAPAVGATDPQFTNWFHLPNEMVAGGVDRKGALAAYRTMTDQKEWTEDDELDLDEANINVRQEEDRRNEVQEKLNKGEATQAELDKAELDVKKARKKVLDLQKQKDAAGAGQYIAPQAPELAKRFTTKDMERLDAQIAVDEANEKRNETYDNPESTERDRLRADMELIRAEDALQEVLSGKKDGKDYSLRGILKSFVDNAGNALVEGVIGQIPFGLGESRWLSTDWKSLVPEQTFSKEEIESQLPVTPGDGDWAKTLMDTIENARSGGMFDPEELKKRLKVYDSGGWLEPGGMAINLSQRPEPIFNSPDQLRQFAGDLHAPEQRSSGATYSINMGDVTTADVDELIKKIRLEQKRQSYGFSRR